VIGVHWTEELDSFSSIPDLAKHIAGKIREFHPDQTYDLLGESFGSLVAFEVAVELQRQMGPKGAQFFEV